MPVIPPLLKRIWKTFRVPCRHHRGTVAKANAKVAQAKVAKAKTTKELGKAKRVPVKPPLLKRIWKTVARAKVAKAKVAKAKAFGW